VFEGETLFQSQKTPHIKTKQKESHPKDSTAILPTTESKESTASGLSAKRAKKEAKKREVIGWGAYNTKGRSLREEGGRGSYYPPTRSPRPIDFHLEVNRRQTKL